VPVSLDIGLSSAASSRSFPINLLARSANVSLFAAIPPGVSVVSEGLE
jgi:hypothetical protein